MTIGVSVMFRYGAMHVWASRFLPVAELGFGRFSSWSVGCEVMVMTEQSSRRGVEGKWMWLFSWMVVCVWRREKSRLLGLGYARVISMCKAFVSLGKMY